MIAFMPAAIGGPGRPATRFIEDRGLANILADCEHEDMALLEIQHALWPPYASKLTLNN